MSNHTATVDTIKQMLNDVQMHINAMNDIVDNDNALIELRVHVNDVSDAMYNIAETVRNETL